MWTGGRPLRGSVPRRWGGPTGTGGGPATSPSWSTRSNGETTDRREAAFGAEGTSVRVSPGDHQGLAIAMVLREGIRSEPAGGPAHPVLREEAAQPDRGAAGGPGVEIERKPGRVHLTIHPARPGMDERLLHVGPDAQVLLQVRCVFLLGVPSRSPILDDPQAKPVRMYLLP